MLLINWMHHHLMMSLFLKQESISNKILVRALKIKIFCRILDSKLRLIQWLILMIWIKESPRFRMTLKPQEKKLIGWIEKSKFSCKNRRYKILTKTSWQTLSKLKMKSLTLNKTLMFYLTLHLERKKSTNLLTKNSISLEKT